MLKPQLSSSASRIINAASNDPGDDYERDLFQWLVNAKDYRKFERRVADELSTFKLNGWAYIRLDIPIQLSASDTLGTICKEHSRSYDEGGFYECDLLIQHVNESMLPVFKSDIDNYVQNSPFVTADMKRYKELSKLNESYGCNDSYCIPLANAKREGRALFALNSKGMHEQTFKSVVNDKSAILKAIGRAINDAGVINFPDLFTDGKRAFEKMVNSQPFNLLVTMVKYDLTLNQAADRLGISVNTAQKHISNIRRALNAKTNYGAYETALRQGLIVAH